MRIAYCADAACWWLEEIDAPMTSAIETNEGQN